MPKKAAASTKTQQKKVAKVVEDKTFGLKNKNKSKKVQTYVTQVQKNAQGNQAKKDEPQKSKKQLKAEKDAELNQLFRPVNKSQSGVDPKSVLCEFFKQGTCTKGVRCKFSHDWAVERKSGKADMFTDRREAEGKEGMDDWDETKLREVVNKKDNQCRTEIICKYFLNAIEGKSYGWFWECPNGGDKCIYRHALPPGYVMKSKKGKEDEGPKIDIIDQVEEERRNLRGGTPLTLELFLQWKEKKRLEKDKKVEDRKKEVESGKAAMKGRELFEYNPELAAGDDSEAMEKSELDATLKETEAERETAPAVVVDANLFAGEEVEELPDFDDEETTTTTTTTTSSTPLEEQVS